MQNTFYTAEMVMRIVPIGQEVGSTLIIIIIIPVYS